MPPHSGNSSPRAPEEHPPPPPFSFLEGQTQAGTSLHSSLSPQLLGPTPWPHPPGPLQLQHFIPGAGFRVPFINTWRCAFLPTELSYVFKLFFFFSFFLRSPIYLFIFNFWPCHAAYGILVPQPGIQPRPLAES